MASDQGKTSGTGSAGGSPVTLETLRDALNAQGERFNQLLAAYQATDERVAQLEMSVREVQAFQRESVLRPAPVDIPASGLGGATMTGDVQVVLNQILADIQALKERPLGAATVAEQKKLGDAALRRESQAHQGDRMMYHRDPGHAKVAIVVATDAEARDAALNGYCDTLELAARAGLTPEVTALETKDPQGFTKHLYARMELIKKGMFKVA